MTDSALPVAPDWFRQQDMGGGLTLIVEPHVDVLMRANIWHLRGRDHDLLIDGGLGVAPLRPALPGLFAGRDTVALATHTHADHIGAIHEFEQRWVHPVEAASLATPRPGSLISDDIPAEARQRFLAAGYPPLGPALVTAVPHAGYDLRSYALQGAAPTRLIEAGETVDLGDRRFRVLHVPGHSPGSIALFEEATGTLFAGDVIYDGPLLYRGPGMDIADYISSFALLKSLPVTVVHAGHDDSFGKARLDAIIDAYLARWRAEGLVEG
ncbi:glyoxylase-like metal-dependent hydrolase (beta-lactamase superfamily II) [Inquilinus ginsengisoli]|uniref:Glyoxylase-like metal-dependent hydrolase (Beta-lactamase superfamily II) n=1 Tax=Inquilinus ginsengisoli TaxID=363840 RepID=A0ABU1JR11_9PROT|nr:MBL fold metallo-hydrolase [Inquilinus ginsengisoli]MDR6291056.1 glyoxylase-like metal-dependent hydrolase (beta-lactamase superfamily II) [Inquilinus ginsengisoli]